MKTIYFIRHGESKSNVGGVIMGGAKTALTAHGRAQASFVGERLSRLAVDIVVSSTYLRARQTGEIIAEKIMKPIEYSNLFVEWHLGSNRIGKRADDPELLRQLRELIEHVGEEGRIADEENFSDLDRRAAHALAYLADRPEQNMAVVSHGWFLPVLFGKAVMGSDFTGRDCQHFMKTMRMQNTGLTVVTHGDESWWGPWNVVTWNDHAHLG